MEPLQGDSVSSSLEVSGLPFLIWFLDILFDIWALGSIVV